MSELRKALTDIGNIRLQLAAGTMFRGFGPPVIAVTGLLAFITAVAQSVWPELIREPVTFFGMWVATAFASAVLIGVEMIARTYRHHSGLADAMLWNAVEHFLPVGAAGAVIATIVLWFAADAAWVLPGLWQMLLGVGLFATVRFLPRSIAIAGGWYFVAGAAVLMLSSQTRALSPWLMGMPFAIGQLVVAGLLHVAYEDADEQD